MGTKDISRSMFDPRKHYTAKWMQQGRIVTDFDENDGEAIAAEERRRTRVDVIGAYGSPDDGFRITNVRRVGGGALDFDLNAGTLYVGGLRLELEAQQTFNGQTDLLQSGPISAPVNDNRRDLVLLEAFEAPVTAVEDAELLDPALGGADTAARGRRFQRIHVIPGVNALDCDQAWGLIADMLDEVSGGSIGADCRRVVDTRLTVTYTDEGVDDDLCEPPLTGGYLGAENQALRVQIVAPGLLAWGYDNVAPLYRVSLSADRTRVTLITPPRDEYSTPVVGQIIEVLPWSGVLANGEKTAALSGHLSHITAVDLSDESAGGAITITLANPVPTATFEEWRSRPDAAALEGDGAYFFMQIWNRGGDQSSPAAIPFTVGTPVTLGTTGIQVTITGNDQVAEDYWIISARPETPHQALPWTLEAGAAPNGVTRYFAPLAIIHWHSNNTVTVTDCRPPFRPLTSMNGCCTYTVGDGKTSDGDYNDLALALERLGSTGGEICLLPGTHRANVELVGRSNITISGCGGRSRLIPANPEAGAAIRLQDGTGISLTGFEVVDILGSGIVANRVSGLVIHDLKVLAGVVGIDVDDSTDVSILRCVVRLLDREQGDVGIYVQGDRVAVVDCDIQVIPSGDLPQPPEDDQDPDRPPVDPTDPCADPEGFYGNILYLPIYVAFVWEIFTLFTPPKAPYQTLGGLQVGSGSDTVLIRRNLIVGGAGNGITLGSDIADLVNDTPPVQPADESPFVLSHDFPRIRGQLWFEDKPIGGMSIIFEDEQGELYSFPVRADGTFSGELPPGTYTVTVTDDAYRVVQDEALGQGAYYFVLDQNPNPRSAPPGGRDLLAFIQVVSIERNRIANMGLAGIGSPRFASSDEAVLGDFFHTHRASAADLRLMLLVYTLTGTITGFVVDLVIIHNTIVRCVLDSPPLKGERFTLGRAVGGIAIALVDGLTITENRIEDCGSDAALPLCGIYAALAIDVTVRENHVLNNGGDTRAQQVTRELAGAEDFTAASSATGKTLSQSRYAESLARFRLSKATGNFGVFEPTLELQPGIRGGIVLPICLAANVFMGGATRIKGDLPQDITTLAEGHHAARIDANYVVQPFGKALLLGGIGSMSVTDNQLIADTALTADLDARSGGIVGLAASGLKAEGISLSPSNVLVFNVGVGANNVEVLNLLRGVFNPDVLTKFLESGLKSIPFPFGFPDGNVLFAGNQIRQGDGGERENIVTLFSFDDVNMADNQIEVLNGDSVRATAALLAASVRTSNNRMKEPVMPALRDVFGPEAADQPLPRYSLVQFSFSLGTMNANQGNYCFRLYGGGPTYTAGNLSALDQYLKCTDEFQPMPEVLTLVFVVLLTLGARFVGQLYNFEQP